MNLCYDLPDVEKGQIEAITSNEEILYCTPYDLDIDGTLKDGWFAVTKKRILIFLDGKLKENIPFEWCSDFKATGMVGGGMLEGKINGEPQILIRYTMSHVPRYVYIEKILNQLAQGKVPNIKSVDEQKVCPRCGRVFPPGTRVCPACTSKLAVIKRLIGMSKPYWPVFLLAIVILWANTGINLLTPKLNGDFIDNTLRPADGSIQLNPDIKPILVYVLLIALCSLSTTALTILRGRVMVKAGNSLTADLRQMVFSKVQSLSLSYLDQRETGNIMNRINEDTRNLKNFIQDQFAMGLNEVCTVLGIAIILFINNWKLALLVIVPMPIVAFVCKVTWSYIRRMYHIQWRKWDRANSLLQDILSGIRVVKAFGQEEKEVKRFEEKSKDLADNMASNEKYYYTLTPLLGFITGLGHFLVMYYGGVLVLGEQLTLGELVQFSSYASYVYSHMGWLTSMPKWFNTAMTSAERVFEIIDEEPEIMDKNVVVNHKINGDVQFKHVTFGYRSHEPVLEDINVDVKKGEMIGLVGHSGAGKSTMINLIMRLYDVDEGQILIDGVDIREMSQQELRSQIGVVLQETFLFSGSILDNIRYSKPDATLDEVIRAAKIANAHDFIMRFPDGYDTKVGEKGQRLSGGERQRIAIARAIIHDPKILILDEATASVDTETEQQIQEALQRVIKNRTTFAIAHRLSTLKNADRLLVFDKGRIAEFGTHSELLRKKGIYYKLVTAQRKMSRMRGIG